MVLTTVQSRSSLPSRCKVEISVWIINTRFSIKSSNTHKGQLSPHTGTNVLYTVLYSRYYSDRPREGEQESPEFWTETLSDQNPGRLLLKSSSKNQLSITSKFLKFNFQNYSKQTFINPTPKEIQTLHHHRSLVTKTNFHNKQRRASEQAVHIVGANLDYYNPPK